MIGAPPHGSSNAKRLLIGVHYEYGGQIRCAMTDAWLSVRNSRDAATQAKGQAIAL